MKMLWSAAACRRFGLSDALAARKAAASRRTPKTAAPSEFSWQHEHEKFREDFSEAVGE